MNFGKLLEILLVVIAIYSTNTSKVPTISNITSDLVANLGDTVQFNCTIENVGRMSVSWAKRTSDLDAGSVVLSMRNILSLSDPRYSISEIKHNDSDTATYIFKITKVEPTDTGAYECQVIVTATDKVTAKLNFAVRHQAIISTERTPRNVLIAEGAPLNITCYADGYPLPTIIWQRENNAIMPTGGQILSAPTLHISQVNRLDRGNYICIASNGVGDSDRRSIRLEVEFAPQIAVQRPKITQMLAHPAVLQCTVQAYPAPAVTWYHNQTKLDSNDAKQISNTASPQETTTSVLRIARINENDFGDYYCNATNKMGRSAARLRLFQSDIPVPTTF